MQKRQRLRTFLLNEIDLLTEGAPDDGELLATLRAAVRGLENLDLGQIDPIFVARKWGRGREPANVKRYEAHAVGHAFSLHKKCGLKVMDADQLVAKAYGITCDALSQWKKKLKHSNDPALLEIIESYKTNVVFPTNITKMQLKTKMLAEVARKGQIYRNARKSKKGKKTI